MLGDTLTGVLFGRRLPPAAVGVGLAFQGRELVDPGYQRQQVPVAEWKVAGGEATVDVTFGPFQSTVDIDAGLVVVDGDERVARFPQGPLRLTAGVLLDLQQVIRAV